MLNEQHSSQTSCPSRFQEPLAPRISMAAGRALYVGPGLQLAPHRNAAATLALALDSPFLLTSAGLVRSCNAALIAPNTRHHLRASGPMAFLYLDALSDDYAALSDADIESGAARLRGHFGSNASDWTLAAIGAALAIPQRAQADPRIAAIVRAIDEAPQDFTRIADAARGAGLSPSRFQHLMRAAVGMPFRRYRLWRRMGTVLRRAAAGEDLTQAALDAGFASSAHLSATFKAMFGVAPSALIARGVRIDWID